MQPYQPFLIAPFKTGLDSDLEPWLLPADAFTEIENGHIHHGYIERRAGYRFLSRMSHGQAISAATNANPAVFTVASTAAYNTGDTVTLHYLAGGTWANLNEQSYTITVTAPTTFTLVDSSGAAVDGTTLGAYTANSGRVAYFPGNRIMGIFRFISSDNTRLTLVADTQRVGLYSASSRLIDPLDLFDITSTLQTNNDVFSSSDTDYIWAANWQSSGLVNRVYFTNGKEYQAGAPGTDGLLYYDNQNARVEQFQPSLGGTNVLYGSKLIFSIRQRLVCLFTFEYNGSTTSTFPQRARWCAAQAPGNWNDTVAGGGGFVDAPTGDQIISARQLQDVIIVNFTDSVWTLRPVPDPALPFRWDKINDFRSCDGKMATVGFDRYSVAVGLRGITATDGVETRRTDDRIQDFVTDDVNDQSFDKVFAARSYGRRRTWILYPSKTSTEADGALIYDDESGAYSKYTINMNVLGYGSVSVDYAAQDFTAANNLDVAAEDLNEETASSYYWSDTAELFLGGDRSGNVYVLETLNTDDGTEIEFSMVSAGWNPFKEQGIEAQLGYVDFYTDSDQITKMEIEFYKNDNNVPYASQQIDLLPNLNFVAGVASVLINPDPTLGFTVYNSGAGLATGDQFYMYGIEGANWLNDEPWTVGATVTANSLSVDTDITSYGAAITNITQANPGVVTSANHNFSDGDVIYIVNVSGMVEVNNLAFTVANSTTNTFELSGTDTSGFTAYSTGGHAFLQYLNGGQITLRQFYRTKVWKRAYAGGFGYEHRLGITSSGAQEPFRIHAIKPWFKPRGRRTLG